MASDNNPLSSDAPTTSQAAPPSKPQPAVPQTKPLPGTNVSPGVYHQELLREAMPDAELASIIAFARKHPAVPPQAERGASKTLEPTPKKL